MIASLKASSQEKYQSLARYHKLTEAERQIRELTALNHSLLAHDEKIAELNRVIKDLLNSTSWRYTAPLRRIGGLFAK